MGRGDLSDAEWELIGPLLPPHGNLQVRQSAVVAGSPGVSTLIDNIQRAEKRPM